MCIRDRFVTALGSQATYITVPFQLKNLTHSPLEVGALGLVELVPLVVFGLYGGVLADRLNRRRLIISMEQLLMASTAVLLINALLKHPQVWVLYADAVVAAGASSLQRPSIEALNQMFVPHELQRAASTLANIRYTTASIIGPALGGLVAVAVGPASVYAANLVTFACSLLLLFSLRATVASPSFDGGDIAAMTSGLRYALSRPDIVGTYVIDLLAMILAFPVVMLPFVAERFHETYALALLLCGLPAGALLATLTSAWTRKVHRYGLSLIHIYVDPLRRAGRDCHRLGGRSHATRGDRGRHGRQSRWSPGASDEPGPSQVDGRTFEVQHRRDIHQPAAREDRRHVCLLYTSTRACTFRVLRRPQRRCPPPNRFESTTCCRTRAD